MKCPKCQAEQPDSAKFCSQCAEPLITRELPKELPVGSATPVWAVILILLCIAIIVLLLIVANHQNEPQVAKSTVPIAESYKKPDNPVTVPQTLPPPPQPQAYTQPIVNSAATIKARSISWYPLTVPANATSPVVTGRFVASGGSGNDIIIYVVDSDSLENLKNNHASSTFFNSGRVTQGPITAVLPPTPGLYYLVLDNRFSIITPKAVQVNATLSYVR
jgi:hypothetical protein